jgi:hypothetical protein
MASAPYAIVRPGEHHRYHKQARCGLPVQQSGSTRNPARIDNRQFGVRRRNWSV